MPRHSKLQLQILSLYRQFLRTAKDKPETKEYIKSEFKKHASIPKKSVLQIEQIVRRAERQLESLKKPTSMGISVYTIENKNESNV